MVDGRFSMDVDTLPGSLPARLIKYARKTPPLCPEAINHEELVSTSIFTSTRHDMR